MDIQGTHRWGYRAFVRMNFSSLGAQSPPSGHPFNGKSMEISIENGSFNGNIIENMGQSQDLKRCRPCLVTPKEKYKLFQSCSDHTSFEDGSRILACSRSFVAVSMFPTQQYVGNMGSWDLLTNLMVISNIYNGSIVGFSMFPIWWLSPRYPSALVTDKLCWVQVYSCWTNTYSTCQWHF